MKIFIAFFGGIISFISPCVLPMIPMYISYISGLSVKEIKGEKRPLMKIFINSLFFVLGFTVIFTLLAALLYLVFSQLGGAKVWVDRVAGLIIVIFGLHIMGVINIPFLNYEMKMKTGKAKATFLSSFIMGIAFGAGWTPCIGPILSGILFTSTSSQNPMSAVLLLIVYSLGIGIPFILTGLATAKFLALFDKLKKHYKVVEIVSGIFLVILGILIATNLMSVISAWASQAMPGLSNLEYNFTESLQNATNNQAGITNKVIETTNKIK